MRSLELRIPPVALAIIFAVAMAAVAYAVPADAAIRGKLAVAILLVLTGGLVGMAGVVAFRRHRTTVNPFTPAKSTSLVSTGIYRFSRNPMYLGLLLALFGWCAYLANWASALMLPAFVAYMNRFQIQPEERALTEMFGPQFLAYSKSVRRWL
ncbi:MAG: isoprenylcysteine carboxylmethyltransferase family protein [Gammaproteobacteria bacterium]|nr:isoprenylcysteine carboxylmethyltransferase family protein [Gammaproteobacteria bacterium]MBU1647558.1 isoprenylcysteine carboxylmethyltransferase family protein [Gammaproteobacteria bacterium]MBU1973739.1 isoprenylcysteine carboxylmethyltransferase family protein [Gammaproteobacteria bacterium]